MKINICVYLSFFTNPAFWGDSDDSNSDIEAALRPQVHDSYENEFFWLLKERASVLS